APYEGEILQKVMQASFKVLNQTHPGLTKECWLCYDIRPPFYEAIGVTTSVRRRNGTNPRECLWKQGRESTPRITLTQINRQGACVG
ncbi:ENV2 protein, partial [Melanocharis versteri]|nr:ENV2 protein [Melanocharis versteri]